MQRCKFIMMCKLKGRMDKGGHEKVDAYMNIKKASNRVDAKGAL